VFNEFLTFYRKLAVRNELDTLLLKVSDGKNVISLAQLLQFLKEEQHMVSATGRFCLN